MEIAEFILEKERLRLKLEERIPPEDEIPSKDNIPSYNMKDFVGWSPVFRTSSARILGALLNFADLEVSVPPGVPSGIPPLWMCARNGCVTERVAKDSRLREQYGIRFNGTLPLEEGETKYNLYFFKQLD